MNFHVGKKKQFYPLLTWKEKKRKEKRKKNLGLKQFYMNRSNLQKWNWSLKAIFLPEALLLGKSQLPAYVAVLTARLQILRSCTCWRSSASFSAVGSVRKC